MKRVSHTVRMSLFVVLIGVGIGVGTAGAAAGAAPNPDLTFFADPGIRIDHAGLACPSVDPATGLVTLYYEDNLTHRARVATSANGLVFVPGVEPVQWLDDPRVLTMPEPDAQGNPIYRRYLREPDGTFVSESSSDGVHFRRDPGIRYRPQPIDRGTIGVYDHFVNDDGAVVLLYIGDMAGVNNVRRAVSEPGDNGTVLQFDRGDVMGDASAGGGPNSYVDQKSIRLPDGRRRLFVMRQGTIYSFLGEDDGTGFVLEDGVRLAPEDFAPLHVRSLHDPWCVRLPDGRYRIYLHGWIEDSDGGRNAILSATTAR